MFIAEITIAILLGLLIVVTSAYLTYFLVNNHKKITARVESGDYEEEPKSVKGKIVSISLIVFFVFSLFTFTTNVIYRTSPFVNNQYFVSIKTDSMSQAIESNDYLKDNGLTNQIAQYDIAVFDKAKGEDIQQYDIILFKKNNTLITHRVIEVKTDHTFVTQGDKNINPDNWVVTYDEVIGKYNHSLVFMSFINYLGYTPGFYVFLVGITYDLGVILFFEIKKEKELKKAKEKEC